MLALALMLMLMLMLLFDSFQALELLITRSMTRVRAQLVHSLADCVLYRPAGHLAHAFPAPPNQLRCRPAGHGVQLGWPLARAYLPPGHAEHATLFCLPLA